MQRKVKKEFVTYQGRSIPKEHFRVYVYSKEGQQLVESYEEFKACLSTKEWFETKLEAQASKTKVKKHDANSPRVCE